MDLGLNGKRALVLGSTRGIGHGIATALASEGATVAVCGRDASVARKTAQSIATDAGAVVRGYAVDLTDLVTVNGLIDSVVSEFGGIDILVANCGGPPPGRVSEVSADTWLEQFQAVFLSVVELASACLPGMKQRGWGRILISSSSGAVQPIGNLGISNTLRAGLASWAKTLADEVAPYRVTVNTLIPGRIHTDRVDEIDAANARRQNRPIAEVVKASHALIPVGRYGTVQEFAAVAVFVASERASYVTGSMIRVDGGMIRGLG